mgnify:FL=1
MTSIKELIKWHEEQAKYFSAFGADNAVTVFHRSAAHEIREMMASVPPERKKRK